MNNDCSVVEPTEVRVSTERTKEREAVGVREDYLFARGLKADQEILAVDRVVGAGGLRARCLAVLHSVMKTKNLSFPWGLIEEEHVELEVVVEYDAEVYAVQMVWVLLKEEVQQRSH